MILKEYYDIYQMINSRASRSPDSVAIIFKNKVTTYGQLLAMAQKFSQELQAKKASPGMLIGIDCQRSVEMIAVLIAALHNQCPFFLLNTEAEYEKKQYCIRTINPFLFYRNGEIVRNPEYREDKPNPSLAYVIFTSGTVGRPKGVGISAKSLLQAAQNLFRTMDIHEGERLIAMADVTFDLFIMETLLALCNGIEIVLADHRECSNPRGILRLIENHNVSVMQAVPSKLKMLCNGDPTLSILGKLQKILIGGEIADQETLKKLLVLPHLKLYHLYGMTEDTIWTSVHRITSPERLHIGTPFKGHHVSLLNQDGKPTAVGEEGEIYISGDGIYEKIWLPAPVDSCADTSYGTQGIRRIATGDIGRLNHNYQIEICGRNDHIAKYMGYRINLNEVERLAGGIPGVDAVVAVFLKNQKGKELLCLFFTSEQGVSAFNVKRYMEKTLPVIFTPCYAFSIDAIPYLPSGKKDRRSEIFQTMFNSRKNYVQ